MLAPQRVAIVNRGEAAMRLIHAVRELNARGGHDLRTIALHTDGERSAMFVREADEAYAIGPASARPYLDHAVLERALVATRADAAWVGWGFVAEDAGFAELCARIGVTFVGPSPQAMRTLGDKIGAKLLAEEVGVPVAAWSNGPVEDLDQAVAHANRIGYPLMLKAAAGGGGRGIRVVTSDAELAAVFERTRDEAQRAFGSGVCFLERLVTGARHVEVQLIADGQGTAWALGVRDCSIQRRNQKLLEESASPVLDPEQVAQLKASAERLALAVGYSGAGTAEFLYQPAERTFAFLEVNTRLQVEHSVTELTTDTDLVRLQLLVADGGRLEGAAPPETGHAIEARLNAEDPDRDFAPAPGRIALLRLPTGPGVRVDTGVAEGDVIPADFDSMIAKVIAYGPSREVAIARLVRALEDTTVVIEGGTTNKSFLLDLLARPEVLDGSADTGWIDRERTTGGLVDHRGDGIAVVAAGIDAYDAVLHEEQRQFLAAAHGGRPLARHDDDGRDFELKLRGTTHKVEVAQVDTRRYQVVVDGVGVEVERERQSPYAARLVVAGRPHRVVTATHAADHIVEVDAAVHRITKDEGGVLRSPAPALVVSVMVAAGSEVTAGAPVLVLESMKMETVLPAPFTGRVREVLVAANDQVGAGQPMLRMEPAADGEAPTTRVEPRRLDLPVRAVAATTQQRALAALADLRSMLLGYDLTPEAGRERVAAYQQARAELSRPEDLSDAEIAVLAVFADLCELVRNRAHEQESSDERVHSPREYFHSYLHSLDVDRERLPEDFRAKLGRVLAHYGVDSLDRTPALEDAVHRVFLAQQRTPAHVPAVATLLERWLTDAAPDDGLAERARDVLDRLVHATQLRYPVVGDLARSVRYRWFDAPLVEAVREQTYTQVRDQLTYLTDHPEAPDYDDRVEALVSTPEPLVRFLVERITDGPDEVAPLLHVLARRHYREHTLDALATRVVGGRSLITADYTLDDRPTHLVSTAAVMTELDDVAATIEAAMAATPPGREDVVDLYLSWPTAPSSVEATATELAAILGPHPFARSSRRVAVATWAGPGHPVRQYTFRPNPDGAGVVEDSLVRGLHPMVGRRLDLWRLRNFTITRLEAAAGVLLYKCVAPGNESDVRLVALAQIRELSVVRDGSGRVTSLPQAERAIASCVDAIRRARTAAGPRARLDMNHVWLHIWPVIDAPVEQLTALQRAIAPLTVGAGVEEIVATGRITGPKGSPVMVSARFSYQPGSGVEANVSGPPTKRLEPLDDYAQKVLRSRRRGTVYPYEVVPLLIEGGGEWVEYDLSADSGVDGLPLRLEPVDRPAGGNSCGIVVGLARTPTPRYPEGISRVVLAGDPTRSLGAIAEAECAARHGRARPGRGAGPAGRVVRAVGRRPDLDGLRHREHGLGGAGAAPHHRVHPERRRDQRRRHRHQRRRPAVLERRGHDADAHQGHPGDDARERDGADRQDSLDYSGGVSAEDNFGLGGYDRVMGPNGQAQYWAPDLAGAVDVLFAHYEHSYVAPGETGPRPAVTTDPRDRDVCSYPHQAPDSGFTTVGDIFSAATNPERKKPFDIRTVMRAVADPDHPTLERWAGMADAETSVVFDAHLGGYPVALIGIESRPVAAARLPATDGPDTWTAGTLFPRSSKKTARAINAASGSRPLVVLANLSGFDGSPESMRMLQLEYGAEIGRAVVNFDGPIVFCVVSRYHGGAFVVFSKTLNDRMQVLAVEGSFASVIGGAPGRGRGVRRRGRHPHLGRPAGARAGAAPGRGRRGRARPAPR